ncbi:hypothetical protein F5B22DRAFT_650829 [Xylaria bambusicola]|uniref:uncharacterized protein n=1 Tax=Xylaria bambusicola TaxID=326684 RepID=UPI002007C5EB|nr:uncharacterized protein F5B22DRAFT_650829 [Xylaria bambusicola]KAI0506271.1 hypothetical protein F5B22DRAFT_650829 [Xylaria bambusicola]
MEELFFGILYRGLSVGIVIAIDKFVVQRRDAVVRTVRRLQATLHIPTCLSLVSDTAPGITDESLRIGAEITIFSGIASLALLAVVPLAGITERFWWLVAAIVVSVCLTISVWIYFICARNRFDRGERDIFENRSGNNPGLRRSIGCVHLDYVHRTTAANRNRFVFGTHPSRLYRMKLFVKAGDPTSYLTVPRPLSASAVRDGLGGRSHGGRVSDVKAQDRDILETTESLGDLGGVPGRAGLGRGRWKTMTGSSYIGQAAKTEWHSAVVP